MKIRTSYVCEKCGRAFKTEAECVEHEKVHLQPASADVFACGYNKDEAFPHKIQVGFKDSEGAESFAYYRYWG